MSRPTTPPDPLPPRAVIGAEALAALAVPARLALLNHLLAAGPRTASECAPVVGETASNCSWHLRALEKVGLVERAPRAPDGDASTRPWRRPRSASSSRRGRRRPGRRGRADGACRPRPPTYADDLYRRYLARQDDPGAWSDAAGDYGYALT